MMQKSDLTFVIHWAEGKTADPIHLLASENKPEPKRLTYDELNRALLSFEARSRSNSYNKTKLSVILPVHMVKELSTKPNAYNSRYLFIPSSTAHTIPGHAQELNEHEVMVSFDRLCIGTPDTDPEHFIGLDEHIKHGQTALLKALANELNL